MGSDDHREGEESTRRENRGLRWEWHWSGGDSVQGEAWVGRGLRLKGTHRGRSVAGTAVDGTQCHPVFPRGWW